MLGDGQRRLGSHEVVAGVMAVSAHLTQDAGRAHAAGGKSQKYRLLKKRTSINQTLFI